MRDLPTDSQLALRDRLALDRTHLANERTFLAYVRTAIMIVMAAASTLLVLPSLLTAVTHDAPRAPIDAEAEVLAA